MVNELLNDHCKRYWLRYGVIVNISGNKLFTGVGKIEGLQKVD